jgi:hypothetical protein
MSTFSNLTSSEWAAWIQALGSVLAIGAAARLAIYQSREQHKSALALHNREKLDVQIDTTKVLLELAGNSAKVMKNIKLQLHDRESIYNVAEGLVHCPIGEMVRIDKCLSDIPLNTIPSSLVTYTMILGSTLRQFKEKVEMTLNCCLKMDTTMFADFFKCLAKMNVVIEKVCNDINVELKRLETKV